MKPHVEAALRLAKMALENPFVSDCTTETIKAIESLL